MSLFKTSFRIHAAISANMLMYFVCRLPIFRRIIPSSVYAAGRAKTIITLIVTILANIYRVATKVAYILLIVLLPITALRPDGNLDDISTLANFTGKFPQMVNSLFWLSCVLVIFSQSLVMKATREKYIAIRYMMAQPRKYMLATVPFEIGVFFVAYLPALFIACWLAGAPPQNALLLWFMLITFRLLGEAVQLWFYKHFGYVLFRKTSVVLLAMAAGLVGAILPITSGVTLPTAGILFSLPGLTAMAVCLAFSVWYVFFGYGSWQKAIVQNLKLEYVVQNKAAANQAVFRSVEMKEKDLAASLKLNSAIQSKKGYAYFNAIFFARHRRQLVKPVVIRIIIVAVLFLVCVAGVVFMPDKIKPLLAQIPQTLPTLVFVMYFANMAEKACKAMFYNCDNSMLRYSFYRKPQVILQNFAIRLRFVAGYNMLVAVALCCAAGVLVALSGQGAFSLQMVMLYISALLLSIFFSIHHMFMYYVFQPYTTDLSVKNPFYKILNFIIYLVSFACSRIGTAGVPFAFVVLGVTVVYSVVALVLAYKLSPKMFRVK